MTPVAFGVRLVSCQAFNKIYASLAACLAMIKPRQTREKRVFPMQAPYGACRDSLGETAIQGKHQPNEGEKELKPACSPSRLRKYWRILMPGICRCLFAKMLLAGNGQFFRWQLEGHDEICKNHPSTSGPHIM